MLSFRLEAKFVVSKPNFKVSSSFSFSPYPDLINIQ